MSPCLAMTDTLSEVNGGCPAAGLLLCNKQLHRITLEFICDFSLESIQQTST